MFKENFKLHLYIIKCYLLGISPLANVYLTGEVMKMEEHITFKLTCRSCLIPFANSVYFYVNGLLEDNVRYSGGNCYHKKNICVPTECSCSKKGNIFKWSFTSHHSDLEFSCEMRFIDVETSQLSIQTAILVFNESGNKNSCLSLLNQFWIFRC